jgi:hypothetical protein
MSDNPRMQNTIDKLFYTNGTEDADGQVLLECVVLIRGGSQAMQGVLSRQPDGILKMLSKLGESKNGIDRVDHFIEQFFEWEDVVLIGVVRDVTVKGDLPVLRSSILAV